MCHKTHQTINPNLTHTMDKNLDTFTNKTNTDSRLRIIYIRTSTDEQEPKLQLADIKKISGEGCKVYKEKESAWDEQVTRPVFEKVLSYIDKEKVSDVYVWDFDRLYRNRKKLKEFFQLCEEKGTNIHSYRQNWLKELNSLSGAWKEIILNFLVDIYSWIGEEESRKKSERVRLAITKVGKDTLSYKGKRWGRKPIPQATAAKILRLHQMGHSIRQISKQVKIKEGKKKLRPISKSVVHKVISIASRKRRLKKRIV